MISKMFKQIHCKLQCAPFKWNFWPRLDFVFVSFGLATWCRWKVAISAQIEFLEFFSPSLAASSCFFPLVSDPLRLFNVSLVPFYQINVGDFCGLGRAESHTQKINTSFKCKFFMTTNPFIEFNLVVKKSLWRRLCRNGDGRAIPSTSCWLWKLIESRFVLAVILFFMLSHTERWEFAIICALATIEIKSDANVFLCMANKSRKSCDENFCEHILCFSLITVESNVRFPSSINYNY